MRQVSVSQFSTYQWSLQEDLLRYETLGYDAIGLWRQKVEDHGRRAAIDLIYESKLDVSSVHWAGGFTGSDGRSFLEAVDDAFDAIELASQVNANCLIVHPGSRNGHTNSHAMRLIEKALSQLVPVAEDYGVRLALELIPGFTQSPWTFVHSFSQMNNLLEMFSPEQLGLVLDLYHVGLNEPTLQRLADWADRIALVQLSDRCDVRPCGEEYRQLLGTGEVRIADWIAKLDSVGYSGPLELELHGCGTEGIDYFHRLDHSRDYLLANVPMEAPTPARAAIPAEIRTID